MTAPFSPGSACSSLVLRRRAFHRAGHGGTNPNTSPIAFDIQSLTGAPPCGNAYVAGMRDRHPRTFIQARGAIDPLKGEPAVYIDISGWSPRRIPAEVIRELRGRLSGQFLWGSDYPFVTSERCLSELETLDLPAEVMNAVLHDNAARILSPRILS